MFTMRICNASSILVAQGEGRQEEDWYQVFTRLMRGSMPPGPPSRQVIHANLRDHRNGEADIVVITSFTDGVGNVHLDLPLLVHIEPPQF